MRLMSIATLLLAGCASDPPPRTDQRCEEDGKVHNVGECWTCADKCNSCCCSAGGVMTWTGKACWDAAIDVRRD